MCSNNNKWAIGQFLISNSSKTIGAYRSSDPNVGTGKIVLEKEALLSWCLYQTGFSIWFFAVNIAHQYTIVEKLKNWYYNKWLLTGGCKSSDVPAWSSLSRLLRL